MEQFAKDTYYNEIVTAILALGYRLVGKVIITDADSQYYLSRAKGARATCFTFDVPGKAVLINLQHTEHVATDESYANHWSLDSDFHYGSYDEILTKIKHTPAELEPHQWMDSETSQFIREIDDPINEQVYQNSCCGMHYGYGGDISYDNRKVLTPVKNVVSIMQTFQERFVPLTVEKFESLWANPVPTYVFTGTNNYLTAGDLRTKLTRLFWQRFGTEGADLIQNKVSKPIIR